jgi:taurine dioxygenase
MTNLDTVADVGRPTVATPSGPTWLPRTKGCPRRCAFVDGLRAEHRFLAGVDSDGAGSYLDRVNKNLLVAIHPVVRVHPETGERALFVNPGFTTRIPELSTAESRLVLELLFGQIARPAYTVRASELAAGVEFTADRDPVAA